MAEQGYVHLYTGNGKGKTTAAFGLAVRAALAGKKVFIGQFVKDMAYSETAVGQYLPGITVRQFGKGCFIDRAPDGQDRALALQGLALCAHMLQGGECGLVVLDEITIALYYGLLTEREVLDALAGRAPGTEAVLTGRYAPKALVDAADLVTDMQEIKHYYRQGVLSRKGIDC